MLPSLCLYVTLSLFLFIPLYSSLFCPFCKFINLLDDIGVNALHTKI